MNHTDLEEESSRKRTEMSKGPGVSGCLACGPANSPVCLRVSGEQHDGSWVWAVTGAACTLNEGTGREGLGQKEGHG